MNRGIWNRKSWREVQPTIHPLFCRHALFDTFCCSCFFHISFVLTAVCAMEARGKAGECVGKTPKVGKCRDKRETGGTGVREREREREREGGKERASSPPFIILFCRHILFDTFYSSFFHVQFILSTVFLFTSSSNDQKGRKKLWGERKVKEGGGLPQF